MDNKEYVDNNMDNKEYVDNNMDNKEYEDNQKDNNENIEKLQKRTRPSGGDEVGLDTQSIPQQDVVYNTLANLNREALAKILNKVYGDNIVPQAAYSEVAMATRSWQHLGLVTGHPPVRSGHRVYHAGTAQSTAVTVLLTPETTLDAHSLLSIKPLTVLKEVSVGGTVIVGSNCQWRRRRWYSQWRRRWYSQWRRRWYSQWRRRWYSQWRRRWYSQWRRRWYSQWRRRWYSQWRNFSVRNYL
ncbi:hypothetical protein FHG87_024031 [Trinorchestia longiramus]|nr:hypothetical protein FHG87_024031 [Trinorchestia longiramus]